MMFDNSYCKPKALSCNWNGHPVQIILTIEMAQKSHRDDKPRATMQQKKTGVYCCHKCGIKLRLRGNSSIIMPHPSTTLRWCSKYVYLWINTKLYIDYGQLSKVLIYGGLQHCKTDGLHNN